MTPDWQTISALATAGGTLVLAIATFSAVRSSNRSARTAQESLLAGLRPLRIPSRTDDPPHKALWSDRHVARVEGGRAVFEEENGVIYLALGLRNAGNGIALMHGWSPMAGAFGNDAPAPIEEFRRLTIDLYVPAGGTGYWESAIRDEADPQRAPMLQALGEREPVRIDLLYGDLHGGQRMISRYIVMPGGDDGWYCQGSRHWNVDRPDPR